MADRACLSGLLKEVASARALEALVVARPLLSDAAGLHPYADLDVVLELVAAVVELDEVEVERERRVLPRLRDDR